MLRRAEKNTRGGLGRADALLHQVITEEYFKSTDKHGAGPDLPYPCRYVPKCFSLETNSSRNIPLKRYSHFAGWADGGEEVPKF